MKKAVAIFVVIVCSFLPSMAKAESKGLLPVDTEAFFDGILPSDAAALLDMEGKTYYLAHNLHADKGLRKVYSANYQLSGGLIPWGSEVKIINIQRNYLSFKDVKTGLEWSYWFSGKTRKSVNLKDHLRRVFVKDLKVLLKKVAGVSELDRDGIYDGKALLGMSRVGVLFAMGYPPEFANSKDIMTARDWYYWINRFDKIMISFDRQGDVSKIVD